MSIAQKQLFGWKEIDELGDLERLKLVGPEEHHHLVALAAQALRDQAVGGMLPQTQVQAVERHLVGRVVTLEAQAELVALLMQSSQVLRQHTATLLAHLVRRARRALAVLPEELVALASS